MPIQPRGFRYEHHHPTGVAVLTLNRPERLNALTFDVYKELRDVFRALNDEPGLRAVVLTGSGRGFCSGGDVEDIIGELLSKGYGELLEFTRLSGELIQAILHCRRPVVAAVNGVAAGAGAVMAAACDLRIAADNARIAFLFTKVGLSGADMGASWLLPRLIGLGRASELLLTGDFVDAAEAHRMGLYNRVVEPEQVLPEAMQWAERLARGPSFGLEVTKRLLVREAALDLATAMAAETEIQAGCMLHPDFAEAHRAFREKRQPRFH
jgi:enoyl-CoA hydratase/carnithine racemase